MYTPGQAEKLKAPLADRFICNYSFIHLSLESAKGDDE
jgi:hypothetical protein